MADEDMNTEEYQEDPADDAAEVYDEEDAALEDEPDVQSESKETEDEADEEDEVELGSPSLKEVARKEKERLKQLEKQKKDLLSKMRVEENTDSAAGSEDRASKRLKFLLKQAELVQHFAPTQSEKEAPKKSRGRASSKYTEDAEDAELLRDEEGDTQVGHRLQVQPSIITFGTMREYQMQGLNWLIHLYDNGINGILADEMGLGKTLQTISLIAYLYEYRGIKGPHIVIVPKSTLGNWLAEFRRWCPTIKAIKFHGNQDQRQQQRDDMLKPNSFHVVITSYEMVIKEKSHFRKFHWRYIIIDEAHRIKNENSILSRVVRMLKTNYRLLITGTPLQNNLHELWALLNFLLPEVFSSAEKFDEWFRMGDGGREKEAEVVQQLHKVLRPFLLRRVKSDVERGLPPKKETILKIGMSEMQRKWYAGLVQKDVEALNGGADRSRLLNVVMQLRKCCNHPYLFQGAEPGPPYLPGEHLVENSGKMVLLDKLLRRLKARGSRVLIFSQMTRMLDILEDYLLYRQYAYCRIDGNTSGDDREFMIDDFNREGSERFVFLLSTRAGGLGINLATADIVVLFDSDWNPQMDLQAMDRAHRIGQKKEVQVFRFCVESSIEEKVIEKAYKKLRLDALVIQQGRLQENSTTKVSKEDLLSMVRYGAELVFRSDAANITDADIEALIKKGEESTRELNEKLAKFTENAAKFTMDGGMSLYEYKDEEEMGAQDMGDLKTLIGSNWVDMGKRKRTTTSYSEDQYYKNAMKVTKTERQGGPRLPKMPAVQDFQFYDVQRLKEIYERKTSYELFKAEQKRKQAQLKEQGASEEALLAAMQPQLGDPSEPCAEEDDAEEAAILKNGFKDWSRRDYTAFCKGCEKYGRSAIDQIAQEIEGKTTEEVRAYSKVFWQRYKDLADFERIIANIEKGEEKIRQRQLIMDALASKLAKYKNPWQELKIPYSGTSKGKAFTEEEDRFILCMIHKLGWGNWDALKAEIRTSWRFRFDWYFKSRTPQELSKRAEKLTALIIKEHEEAQEHEKEDRKAKAAANRKPSAKAAETPAAPPAPAPSTGKKRKAPGAKGEGATPPPPETTAKAGPSSKRMKALAQS